MFRTLAIIAALAAVASLAACSSGTDKTASSPVGPPCASLKGDAHWVDKVESASLQWTCEQRPGHNELVGWLECPGGARMYTLDIGGRGYWSMRGQVLAPQSGAVYEKALQRCG